MKKLLPASLLSIGLLLGSGSAAHAQSSGDDVAQESNENEDDDSGKLGLIGLAGLLGLAGLARRDRRPDTHRDGSTGTTR